MVELRQLEAMVEPVLHQVFQVQVLPMLEVVVEE
jgi:hypothetical protein